VINVEGSKETNANEFKYRALVDGIVCWRRMTRAINKEMVRNYHFYTLEGERDMAYR
jgi:hypothetical protein